MSASIKRLTTKPQKLKQNQYEELQQALLPFEKMAPDLIQKLIFQIGKQTQTTNKWVFVMLSPEQNDAILEWIEKYSKRPIKAMRVWGVLLKHLHIDTGEIMVNRQEIAEKINISADNTSRILSELVQCKAITRQRLGREMKYFLNPNIATHLSGIERNFAQAKAPKLELINGGKIG